MIIHKTKYREHSSNGNIFHGEVTLKTYLGPFTTKDLEFKCDLEWNYGGKWKNAIQFAVEYFSAFILKKNSALKLYVEVLDVGWFPVDTRHTTMVYVTLLALSEAHNLEIQGLKFDKASGSLVLPSV